MRTGFATRLVATAIALQACGCSSSGSEADATTAEADRDAGGATSSGDAGVRREEGGVADAGDDAPPTPAGCGTGRRCFDFEDARAPAPVTPNCAGSGAIAIDHAVAHAGTSSLRVDGAAGYCNHVFWSAGDDALAVPGGAVHVRFFVRLASALGDGHVTFLASKDRTSGKDLRLGGQSKIVMWNREADDATLPDLSPQGIAKSVAPVPDRWHCVEWSVDARGAITTSVDESAVVGLASGGSDSAWSKAPSPFSLTDLRLGWESYGDKGMTLWFDDVVVASSAIGCR